MYTPYYEGGFDLNQSERLTIRFVFDERGHRFELNCGMKVKIDLDSVSAFELLTPCCGAEPIPGLLTQSLQDNSQHPNGFELGDCAECGKEWPISHGPFALAPGGVDHVYTFTPDLREWLVHVLSEYLHPLDAILLTVPLETVILSYVDAGAGESTEFLRRTLSGNVMELAQHPLLEKERE